MFKNMGGIFQVGIFRGDLQQERIRWMAIFWVQVFQEGVSLISKTTML